MNTKKNTSREIILLIILLLILIFSSNPTFADRRITRGADLGEIYFLGPTRTEPDESIYPLYQLWRNCCVC